MDKTGLGDRIKTNYENRSRYYLTRRTPVILRLDGKAFHTFTRHCEKPFDENLISAMNTTAMKLCQEIQGAKCAYVQSDEISILITDFEKLDTDAWFDYGIQKMCSVSASIAGVEFTLSFPEQEVEALSGPPMYIRKRAYFDSRCFNIPKEEVVNYFVWRQKDWLRNSVQMLAQAHFSHKELHQKKISDMHEMLHSKNINWTDLPEHLKNGTFVEKVVEYNTWASKPAPVFTENREAIEKYLIGEE
jgi:tRNA(His) guanylyltransferase